MSDGAENDAYGSFLINSYAVKEMAIACRSRGARLIHFSSDFVFGGNMDQREPLTEFSPPDPISVYGHSKLKGEEFAETECERAFLVRVATLFGVGGMSATKSNFVEAVLKKASAEKEFAVVDDQTMSPASASDVAKATLELIRQGCEPGIFHAVNTGFATRYEFAREAIRQAGHSVNLVRPCSKCRVSLCRQKAPLQCLEQLEAAEQRCRHANLAGCAGRLSSAESRKLIQVPIADQ